MRNKLSLCLLLVDVATVTAHEGATGVVKDRMEHMKAIRGVMKGLAPIMQGQVEYDAEAVRSYAETLAAKGGTAMTDLFPEGSIHGPSEALPAIWADWERFAASARELELSATLLAETAGNPRDGGAADPMKAFSRVVATCRGCHDDFRKD